MPHKPTNIQQINRLLLIGSAGRNTGKTHLACSLIARFKEQHTLVGLKVTTITEKDGRCPRGGKGCGVCTTLTGNFEIVQETRDDLAKDTSQLLAAGARAVYWLKVLRTHLAEGMEAVMRLIPERAFIVCESNSVRTVVRPGLFLLLHEPVGTAKQSAAAVQAFADRVILCDGKGHDFDAGSVRIVGDKWVLGE